MFPGSTAIGSENWMLNMVSAGYFNNILQLFYVATALIRLFDETNP